MKQTHKKICAAVTVALLSTSSLASEGAVNVGVTADGYGSNVLYYQYFNASTECNFYIAKPGEQRVPLAEDVQFGSTINRNVDTGNYVLDADCGSISPNGEYMALFYETGKVVTVTEAGTTVEFNIRSVGDKSNISYYTNKSLPVTFTAVTYDDDEVILNSTSYGFKLKSVADLNPIKYIYIGSVKYRVNYEFGPYSATAFQDQAVSLEPIQAGLGIEIYPAGWDHLTGSGITLSEEFSTYELNTILTHPNTASPDGEGKVNYRLVSDQPLEGTAYLSDGSSVDISTWKSVATKAPSGAVKFVFTTYTVGDTIKLEISSSI